MSILLRYRSILLLPATAACLLSTSAKAQQPQLPRLPAPPPMHLVTRSERSQLDGTRDPKLRLHTTLNLAEDHLTRAENFTEQRKFDEASEELGSYLGLIGDLRDYFASLNRDKNSTRDLYRHLDIALRGNVSRLEVIRRSTPVDYAENLKAAAEYARNARSEALEAFYGHTVLRDEGNKTKNPPPENKLP